MNSEAVTIARQARVHGTLKSVLLDLAIYADGAGDAYPSVELLAADLGVTPRQIFAALKRLKALGHLAVVQEGGGRGRRTIYRILNPEAGDRVLCNAASLNPEGENTVLRNTVRQNPEAGNTDADNTVAQNTVIQRSQNPEVQRTKTLKPASAPYKVEVIEVKKKEETEPPLPANAGPSSPSAPQANGKKSTEWIMHLWNAMRPRELALCSAWSDKRHKHAQARLKDHPEPSSWEQAIGALHRSPFCRGENTRKWRASIDFLLERPDAITRLIEGAYMDGCGTELDTSRPMDAWNAPGANEKSEAWGIVIGGK